jgi:hypothetical protein
VLLLGFAGALRRSEITSLDCSDVREADGGLVLRLRRSKTDPEAAGQEIGIPKGSHQETDPVIALQRWRRLAEIDSGPLFRVIDRRDHLLPERMSNRDVSRILARAALSEAPMCQAASADAAGRALRSRIMRR